MSITDNINEYEVKKNRKRRRGPSDGRSLKGTHDTATEKQYMIAGFSEESAKRMIKHRHRFPFELDGTQPTYDARTVWSWIGKPQGKFANWVKRDLMPTTSHLMFQSQISDRILTPTGKRGGQQIDYLLSRDVVMDLGQQARTPEGQEIRAYFRDMEKAVYIMGSFHQYRVSDLVELDKTLKHWTRKTFGSAGASWDETIFSLVARAVSGYSAGVWKTTFNRPIRDVLNMKDLERYGRCLEMMITLLDAGITNTDTLYVKASGRFGGDVEIGDYITTVEQTERFHQATAKKKVKALKEVA
ncbi:hypothetical protein [Thiorhodococcus fuscus]|uniref:AntA/AntB antirepressor domain-containing protein n=1 Tax=Thiorhodococcus fuscus TaxID=527200 RepID=A0ABW4Y6B2_9GAMM